MITPCNHEIRFFIRSYLFQRLSDNIFDKALCIFASNMEGMLLS